MMAFECGLRGIKELVEHIQGTPSQFDDFSAPLQEHLEGMSGLKFRLLMSESVAQMHEDLAYLEIGIFQGLTPLTVARRNPSRQIVGVDDFSQFDQSSINSAKIQDAIARFNITNFSCQNGDFEKFLNEDPLSLRGRVGVYFFDASHDFRSQILALMYAPSYLARGGMIVVDDCNYPHVRQATIDFLRTHPEYKLLCEFYTGKHPNYWIIEQRSQNRIMRRLRPQKPVPDPEHTQRCRESWWNGVNIIVHDPEDILEPIFPEVPDNLRGGFLRQHGFAGCRADGTNNRVTTFR